MEEPYTTTAACHLIIATTLVTYYCPILQPAFVTSPSTVVLVTLAQTGCDPQVFSGVEVAPLHPVMCVLHPLYGAWPSVWRFKKML